MDSVNQPRLVEVDQQSEWAPRQLQIRQDLRQMHGLHSFDRLHLDDHLAVHNEVDAITVT